MKSDLDSRKNDKTVTAPAISPPDPSVRRFLTAVMPQVAGIRRMGSAALDLAYVAAGRYDGFWETGLNPWDAAAGIVLIREAGGYVTEIDGNHDPLRNRSILAANPHLHLSLGKVLRDAEAVG